MDGYKIGTCSVEPHRPVPTIKDGCEGAIMREAIDEGPNHCKQGALPLWAAPSASETVEHDQDRLPRGDHQDAMTTKTGSTT
jgi:hypothetical protein